MCIKIGSKKGLMYCNCINFEKCTDEFSQLFPMALRIGIQPYYDLPILEHAMRVHTHTINIHKHTYVCTYHTLHVTFV